MAIKEEELPGPGKEIATVFKLNIAWLRDALAAVGIKANNLTEPGECKAALIVGPSTLRAKPLPECSETIKYLKSNDRCKTISEALKQ